MRVDFEENGVDDGILEELKKVRTSLSLSVSQSLSNKSHLAAPSPLGFFAPNLSQNPSLLQKKKERNDLQVGTQLPSEDISFCHVGWCKCGRWVLACRLPGRSDLGHERGGEQLRRGGRPGAIWVSFKCSGGLQRRPLITHLRHPIGQSPHHMSRVTPCGHLRLKRLLSMTTVRNTVTMQALLTYRTGLAAQALTARRGPVSLGSEARSCASSGATG